MKKRSQRKEWLSESEECRAEPAEGFQRRALMRRACQRLWQPIRSLPPNSRRRHATSSQRRHSGLFRNPPSQPIQEWKDSWMNFAFSILQFCLICFPPPSETACRGHRAHLMMSHYICTATAIITPNPTSQHTCKHKRCAISKAEDYHMCWRGEVEENPYNVFTPINKWISKKATGKLKIVVSKDNIFWHLKKKTTFPSSVQTDCCIQGA